MTKRRKIGIVIFDDVEVLDFCGPLEAFSVSGGREGLRPFEVFPVAAESTRLINCLVRPRQFLPQLDPAAKSESLQPWVCAFLFWRRAMCSLCLMVGEKTCI